MLIQTLKKVPKA